MKIFNVIKVLALFGQILSFCFVIILTNISVAQSELTHDPTIDPIPTFDHDTTEKAVVIHFDFIDPLIAEFVSLEILPGPGQSHLGEPTHLYTELSDLNSNVLSKFYLWHPLWVISFDEGLKEQLTVLSAGPAAVSFPFRPDIASIEIIDVESEKTLIKEDLVPHFHDYCRGNPDDQNCNNIVNRPPNCDANGSYSLECTGEFTEVTLDGKGSTDPDSDPLVFVWTGLFEGGSINGSNPTVHFSGYGQYDVDLNITDDFGGSASCSTEVLIRDTTPPDIECNAPDTIVPSDAPISFKATATDICVGAVNTEIIEFDCFTFTKKGKRIDKTESCSVAINGDTITILDSGGVDDRIIWKAVAVDDSSNANEVICEVQVVNPIKNK